MSKAITRDWFRPKCGWRTWLWVWWPSIYWSAAILTGCAAFGLCVLWLVWFLFKLAVHLAMVPK